MSNLVSLKEYKAYKEISSTDHDVQLQAYLTSVSDFIKSHCSRTIVDYVNQEKTEYINGVTDNLFIFQEFPVINITSVEGSVDGGATYTVMTEFTDYIYDLENYMLSSVGSSFISTSGAIPSPVSMKVIYTGGYYECPSDLKLVVVDLVNSMSQNRLGSATKNLKGGTLQQLSYKVLPEYMKTILANYRVM